MITPQLLRSWSACWDDARIKTYFGKRTELTPRAVASDTSISLDDRLWVLCRCIWYLDESAARLFAIECAATVTHLAGDEDDQAQHAALLARLIEIEDLPAGQREAARGAAREAARGAAREAAREAVWEAARDAARGAAWEAAREAATQNAIDRAIEWLGDYADGWEE